MQVCGNRNSLHSACIAGDLALVKLIVSDGARMDLKDRWGNEPLKYAMLQGHVDVIRYLKQAGAALSPESRIDLE